MDDPEDAYVLLHTPKGPTLWSHNVLLFGSSASVWGYNRFGDAMVSVSRVLLLCPTMHCVDDYGSAEITKHSSSGFQAFEDFNGALGYSMKPSKRQSPAQSHKIQGVHISIEQRHVDELTACAARSSSAYRTITSTPTQPDRQVQFPHRPVVRQGRPRPTQAIYARAHSPSTSLDKPTKAALCALMDIILHGKPMRKPRDPQLQQFAIIYTDAYYTAD